MKRTLPPTRATCVGLAALLLGLTVGSGFGALAQTASAPQPAAVTADQDHQNMMDQLRIQSLRPGVDGFNAGAPNYQNTDEAKASVYGNYPEVLALSDGRKVTSSAMWMGERRPQIVAAYDAEIYGKVPADVPKTTWTVIAVNHDVNGGAPVVTKTLIGHVDNSSDPAINVDIHLSLSTPESARGSVPVMLEFGFPEGFPLPSFPAFHPRPGQPNPFAPPGPTWQQQCLARGYGYAELDPSSVQADSGAGLTQGIIGLCNHGRFRTPEQWGALRAWAWGADRALDYLATDKAVDARQVGIEGLSRYGKATLVTMAYDTRFAIAFVGSSGEGGAKLWRRNFGETEGNIASTGEYHWMAGNFLKYDGPLNPGDMPIDQHELIAVCAPRPVFISCGSPTVEGTWLDDHGMFLATVMAGSVYALLGKKGLGTNVMPPIGTGRLDGDLAWRQHEGGHTTGPNWPYFLQFAARYLKSPGLKTATASALPSRKALQE